MDAQTCPRCFVGHLQRQTGIYTAVLHDQLLSVPGVPLDTCDVCDYRSFDTVSLYHLHQLTREQDQDNESASKPGASAARHDRPSHLFEP